MHSLDKLVTLCFDWIQPDRLPGSYLALHPSFISPKWVSGQGFTRAPAIVGTQWQVVESAVIVKAVLSRLVKLEMLVAENSTTLLHVLPCTW